MALRQIGFWRSRSEAEPTLPDPRDFLDPTWDQEERRVVAAYLRDGRRQSYSMGRSPCRLCGRPNGSATLTDEVYQWPEGLAHYVEEHGVRLPDEFIAHVNDRLDSDETIRAERGWWCHQQPTGTARGWTRWRVQIGPCDAKSAARVREYVTHYRTSECLATTADSSDVAFTVSMADSDDVAALRDDLRALGVAFEIVEERIPAPSELLG